MRTIPDDFLEAHFSSSKEPVQVIEVEFAANDKVYFTSHSSTPTPSGSDVVAGSVSKISSTSQRIDPSSGRSTIGAIRFSADDANSKITDILKSRDDAGYGFRHKKARVYQGFKGMTWPQIQSNLVQTQIITGLSEDKKRYTKQLADIQRATRKQIFTKAKARLSQTVTAEDTLIPVFTSDGFETLLHDNSFTDAPGQRVGYLLIEGEVIRYTGTVVDPTLGLSFVVDQRGALNTIPAIHEVDQEDTSDRATYAEEFVYLEMPAPKMMYALLTGKLYGQGSEYLPKNWHLGIDESLVRLDDFVNAGNDLWNTSTGDGFILRFAGEKEQDGKQFIEQQICLLLSVFMPVFSTGELGLKLATNVLHRAPYVFELNQYSVQIFSAIKFNADKVHNILSVEWNYDFTRDKLTRQRIVVDNASRAKYGDAPVKTLKFRGLHGSRHTTAFIEKIFDRLRDRFAAPPVTMSVRGMPYTNFLEVGDVVRVNLDGKDFFDGGALDRSMEIQSVKVDWTSGNVDFELFGSSRSAGLITPSDPNNSSNPNFAVIADSWYTSTGTDLASYPGVVIDDSSGVSHITGGSGLVGGATIDQGIFYYDGDLILDAGVTLPFSNNVQLRVKGNFQINGTLDGSGNGYAGAAQIVSPTAWQVTHGTQGFYKAAPAGGSIHSLGYRKVSFFNAPFGGKYESAPPLSLDYIYSANVLLGLPADLMGTSGMTGGTNATLPGTPLETTYAGGAGGASGAGLAVVGRGVSFGVSGKIVSNGADGLPGEQLIETAPNFSWQAGTGAGGSPGSVYLIIDGLANNVPDLNKVELVYGASPYAPAVPMPNNQTLNADPAINYSHYVGYGTAPPDLSGHNGGARIVFVPPVDQAKEDLLIPQPLTEVQWEDVKDTSGNKPDDNATQGADWDSNLANRPADENLLNDRQTFDAITGPKPAVNADNTANSPQAAGWLTDAGALATADNVDYGSQVVGTKPPPNADSTAGSPQGAGWLTNEVVGDHNQIDTGNIDTVVTDNAFTFGDIIESYGSPFYLARGSSWQTIRILPFTSQGGDISLTFGGYALSNGVVGSSGGIGYVSFELRRRIGSGAWTVLASAYDLFLEDKPGVGDTYTTISNTATFNGKLHDSPGAGSITYELRGDTIGSLGAYVHNAFIEVEESAK